MGTRSTIKFYEDDNFMCAVYQQFNGFIEGVGFGLKEFLKSGEYVNGFNRTDIKQFNGAGCCVAQYISEHKNGVGNFYITNEDADEEFNYKVNFIKDDGHRVNFVEIKVDDDEGTGYNEVLEV